MKCDKIIIFPIYFFPVGKSTSGKQIENHSHCPGTGRGGGFYNHHSLLERGQYVLVRVYRYYMYYYSSVNALASAHGFSLISSK